MTSEKAASIWKELLFILEEKLQYSILEQAKAVVDLTLLGGDLTLMVTTEEAKDFFNAHVNAQRLIILGRPVVQLEKVSAIKIDAEPLR